MPARLRPETELLPYGLCCPRCGRSAIALPAPGAFVCKNGHELTIEDLILDGATQRRALLNLLHEWESRSWTLQMTAAEAHQHGYAVVAEIYLRQADAMAGRIGLLRQALRDAGRMFESAD